jgi:hypothetical protein
MNYIYHMQHLHKNLKKITNRFISDFLNLIANSTIKNSKKIIHEETYKEI